MKTIEHTYLVFHPVMHAYTCEISSGEPVLTEHVDLNWLSVNELDQLDWAETDIPNVKYLLGVWGFFSLRSKEPFTGALVPN